MLQSRKSKINSLFNTAQRVKTNGTKTILICLYSSKKPNSTKRKSTKNRISNYSNSHKSSFCLDDKILNCLWLFRRTSRRHNRQSILKTLNLALPQIASTSFSSNINVEVIEKMFKPAPLFLYTSPSKPFSHKHYHSYKHSKMVQPCNSFNSWRDE